MDFTKKALQTECTLIGTSLVSIQLTPKQANEISDHLCGTFDLQTVPVYLIDKAPEYKSTQRVGGRRVKVTGFTLGNTFRINKTLFKIELYKGGQNPDTLLHEVAHLRYWSHNTEFYLFWLELLRFFKKTMMKKYLKPIKPIKIIKEKKPNMKKLFKTIIEELELEAVNNTLKMKIIGTVLLGMKLNNVENVTKVRKEMVKRGYRIV